MNENQKYNKELDIEGENFMKCEVCGKKKESVSNRSNAYANDVGNDPDAMHTVCDYCDYQNRMDI